MDTPDVVLKKAGLMLAHAELFARMTALQRLLILAGVMDERGGRVAMVAPDRISIMGADTTEGETFTTAKGRTTDAATCYQTLSGLKKHEAQEYAVTRDELKALNASAVEDLKASPELAAFADTLGKLGDAGSGDSRARRAAPADAPTEATPA